MGPAYSPYAGGLKRKSIAELHALGRHLLDHLFAALFLIAADGNWIEAAFSELPCDAFKLELKLSQDTASIIQGHRVMLCAVLGSRSNSRNALPR